MASNKRAWREDRTPREPEWQRQRTQRRPLSHGRENADEENVRRFRVQRTDDLLRQERCTVAQPKEIAHFSRFASGDVRFDRSNLLRYKKPEIGAKLLAGIEQYVPKDESDASIDPAPLGPFLAALEHKQHGKDHQFVTYRNNLNKIMGTPYNSSSAWTFQAEKRKGCVYLNVKRTQEDLESARNVHENQRRGAYAGRRFEIYSTHAQTASSAGADGAQDEPHPRIVNEDEEFCGIFSLAIGGKRLAVAAEIDCFDDSDGQYLELKTFRLLQRDKDQFVFERFKLLAFWIQSYMVGVPRIVCGFRNDEFEVCKVQTFETAQIPSFCRKYWHPHACVNFTSSLLDWLYENVEEGRVYDVTYVPRQHTVELVDRSALTTSFLPRAAEPSQ